MSCGNRFQCALTKSSRHSFQPDKPSNQELHNENQKRLNDLLKAREEIDKQFFSSNPTNEKNNSANITLIQNIENNIENNTSNISYAPWAATQDTNNFTPWKVPSTTDYQPKAK